MNETEVCFAKISALISGAQISLKEAQKILIELMCTTCNYPIETAAYLIGKMESQVDKIELGNKNDQ
jgi:hypothetical protein